MNTGALFVTNAVKGDYVVSLPLLNNKMKIITIEERLYKIKNEDFKLLAKLEAEASKDESIQILYDAQLSYIEHTYKCLERIHMLYRYS
jgi:hypothetical protein